MRGIILHMLKAATKDALFIGISCFLFASSLFSFFLGYSSLVEKWEASIVYASSIARIISILGYSIFLSFYFKKLIDNKEIEIFLSKSISRAKIIYSFFTAAFLLFLPILLSISILFLSLGANKLGTFFWSFSLLLESSIMVCFSIFFSLLMVSSVNGVIMIFVSYILSRSIGSFVAYITFRPSINIYEITQYILKGISILIPRLDLFAKSSWLLYSDFSLSDFAIIVLQTFIFCGFLLHLIIFDFQKKDY